MKRPVILLFVALWLAVPGWAQTEKPAPAGLTFDVGNQVASFKPIKMGIEVIASALDVPGVQLKDLRLSPVIRGERWTELPVETVFHTLDESLVQALEKALFFNGEVIRLQGRALSVSVSAEKDSSDAPVLVTSLQATIFSGPGLGELPLAEQNHRFTSAVSSVLKVTTFTPQVRPPSADGAKVDKHQPGQVISGGRKHWITNLRLDGDLRMQISGYTLGGPQEVTGLCESLLKTGYIGEVFLSSLNRNTYFKVPVFRFDIVARASGVR